jgi:hypothetical protein
VKRRLRRTRERASKPVLLGRAAAVFGLMLLWWLASEPWGMAVWNILPFVAPGAMLGLAAGWAAHGASRRYWNWRAAQRSALFGALCLPPLLVFVVGIEGNLHPERLLSGFVRTAWIAFLLGGLWALADSLLGVRRAIITSVRRASRTTREDARASGGPRTVPG